LHECTKDGEPGFVGERRESGNGLVCFHVSIVVEISKAGKKSVDISALHWNAWI
jgi:hypothetical protein